MVEIMKIKEELKTADDLVREMRDSCGKQVILEAEADKDFIKWLSEFEPDWRALVGWGSISAYHTGFNAGRKKGESDV